jgi:hypothetical protein
MDAIRQIETGGRADPWIRTGISDGRGSTAYGPYQVTKGLIEGALKDGSYNFDKDETAILRKLSKQQKEALRIGGSDRAKFEGKLSKEHLDRYDYFGTFDFTDAEKAVLLRAQEKMLSKNLSDAGGDYDEAARRWHGGASWATKSERNPDPSAHIKYAEKVRAAKGPQISRDPRPAAPPPEPEPQAIAPPPEPEEPEEVAPREYGSTQPEPVDPNPLQGPELPWALPDAPVSEPELEGPKLKWAQGAHGSQPEKRKPAPVTNLPIDFDITLKKAPEWKMPGKKGMMAKAKNHGPTIVQRHEREKLQAELRKKLEAPPEYTQLTSQVAGNISPRVSKGLSTMGPRRNK